MDYLKIELMKIKEGEVLDGGSNILQEKVSEFLDSISRQEQIVKEDTEQQQKCAIRPSKGMKDCRYFRARLWFKEDSEMENIRSYTVVHNMDDLVDEILYSPKNIIENDQSIAEIRSNGFQLACRTNTEEERIKEYLEGTIFLERLDFEEIGETEFDEFASNNGYVDPSEGSEIPNTSQNPVEQSTVQDSFVNAKQSIISVNVDKLDKLMDIVGEIVIAEAMVTQNPEINELEIESFDKVSCQLHKITGELQDLVMAIRMVPLSTTFLKMHRIVRDMTRKQGKNVVLDVFGEETEVDKNIIEKIADPLMHIIRNAIDHGIESEEERIENGKNTQGNIILEANNSGSDVLIVVKDDGRGLDKKKLYNKAITLGLVNQSYEEMTDRELHNLILHPGFSTNEKVTEYSGRGVGMDVALNNIESIGGSVLVDSIPSVGTTITLKIPLTLAIIEGMNLKVGNGRFTLPIVKIKESFRPRNSEIITDTEGQEMIMVRGHCYPILRLHEVYEVPTEVHNFDEGILIMIDKDEGGCCIFADELLGKQQVVVKALPKYLKKYKNIKGLGGCTLLGDGSISLILDIGELLI
jgi:two-component system chemotaxis sensor kinase CheA